MYAVVVTGGKQYRAAPGEFIDVEKLPVEVGEQVTLDEVLMIADGDTISVGRPAVAGAQVTATVVAQRRQKKVIFFHYLHKHRERKKRGHRQCYTRLRIDEIQAEPPAAETAAPAVKAAPAAVLAGVAATREETPTEATARAVEAAPATAAGMAAAAEPAPTVDAAEAAVAAHLKQLETTLSAGDLANLHEKVEYIEGVGAVYGAKLNQAGIATVMDLLQRGATRKGRAELVEATGIQAGLILTWVNHCDLFRIKGVDNQFGELLEAAGVDTVVELAQRNPVNLFNRLAEVNAEKKLTGRSPRQDEVSGWVEQAKGLPRVVEY